MSSAHKQTRFSIRAAEALGRPGSRTSQHGAPPRLSDSAPDGQPVSVRIPAFKARDSLCSSFEPPRCSTISGFAPGRPSSAAARASVASSLEDRRPSTASTNGRPCVKPGRTSTYTKFLDLLNLSSTSDMASPRAPRWEDRDNDSDSSDQNSPTSQLNGKSRRKNTGSATAAWQAKRKEAAAAYRASVGATQAHGGHSRSTLTANRLYLRDVQLVRQAAAPANLMSDTSIKSSQLQVHREIEVFFRQLLPKLPMQVTCVYDHVEDHRDITHAIIQFNSAASAQDALRAIRQEGHAESARGPQHVSWRYCGLAWEPETFCSSGLQGPTNLPDLSGKAQLFNASPYGCQALQAEAELAAAAKRKSTMRSRLTFSTPHSA